MRSCKRYFKEMLSALMENDTECMSILMGKRNGLHANMIKGTETISSFEESLGITSEYNVRTSTFTNCMELEEKGKSILYATVHHLYAIDEKQEIFPFLFGGKYKVVYDWEKSVIEKAEFDLEYIAGNTYLAKETWIPLNQTVRRICDNELKWKEKKIESVEQVIYRFFWAIDTMNEEIFNENVISDIQIARAGVDGDYYELNGSLNAKKFMEQDKKYYSQNQYSVHIAHKDFIDENHTCVKTWRLYPANTGNKHLGSHNKYSQFYNEIIELNLEKEDGWKVKSVLFKRKENPVPYGYQVLEL